PLVSGRVPRELGQVVGDLVPRGLGAHEDVRRRSDAGAVLQRPHRDVDVVAAAHDREEERPARRTPCVVRVRRAANAERVVALDDLELAPLDAGVGLEGRARRGAAAPAVAVACVQELVGDPIAHGPALAPASEQAVGHRPFRPPGGAELIADSYDPDLALYRSGAVACLDPYVLNLTRISQALVTPPISTAKSAGTRR